MAKCKSPPEFDFTKPETWPTWRRRFDRYRSATELSEKAGKIQVDSLLYIMGPEAESLYDSFTFNAATLATVTTARLDPREHYETQKQ